MRNQKRHSLVGLFSSYNTVVHAMCPIDCIIVRQTVFTYWKV